MKGYFIDIHSHIIPGVDDGAKTIEMSKRMLRLAYKDGIRAIIATPHYYGTDQYNQERVLQQYQLLQEEALNIDDRFRIYLGNEIYYEPGMEESIEQRKVNRLADSQYILVEFPYQMEAKKMYHQMRDLVLAGYRPVLAHVERYSEMRNTDRIRALIELGCYIQVNSDSFLGGMWNGTTKYCRKLLRENLIHLVATDMHNDTDRKPTMAQAAEEIKKLAGEHVMMRILYENPEHILNNEWI